MVASGALVIGVPAGAQSSSQPSSTMTASAEVWCGLTSQSPVNVRLHDNESGDGFRLEWTSLGPVGGGCSDDSGFRVDYRVSGTQTWSHVEVGPDARSASASGLAVGNYEVMLRGFSGTDYSLAENVSFERRSTACPAPTITKIEGRAGRTLYLEWTYAGAADCDASGYWRMVRRKANPSRSTEGSIAGSGCTTTSPCTNEWSGRLGIREYEVRLAAVRPGGISKASAWHTVNITAGGL